MAKRRRPRTLADLPAIKGAKLPRDLERAVRGAPTTRKTKPGIQKVKVRAPRTIEEAASAARVQKQVAAARKRPPKADTGDVRKGTRKTAKRSGDSLKRELEGRGLLAKVSAKAGDIALKHPQIGAAVKAAEVIPGLRGLEERFVKDIVNLPAQAVPSVYVPVAAAVEAVKGRPGRARKFAKDIKESDPIYNLATGKPKKALKLAKEHPGFTAVEVAGAKGTVGRGATRVQRRVTKREPTARDAAVLPGTDLKQPRAYSKDAFTRAGQKMREKDRIKGAERRRREAAALERQDPGRHTDRIDALRAQADKVDPRIMSESEVRKRAAERVAVNEQVRRENRLKVGEEVGRALRVRAGKRTVKPSAATTLAAQNIVDMTPGDLAKYKAEVASQYEGLGEAGRKVNRQLQRDIQKAIDEGVEPQTLRAQAKAYGEIMRPRTQALVDRGMLPAGSADKAPLVPYAVRRMGARHVTDEMVDLVPKPKIKASPKVSLQMPPSDPVVTELRTWSAAERAEARQELQELLQPLRKERTMLEAKHLGDSEAAKKLDTQIAEHEASIDNLDRADVPRETPTSTPKTPTLGSDAPQRRQYTGLVDQKGRPLRSKDIRAHMAQTGTPEPSYVTQAPGRGGAYFVSSSRPQSIPNTTRTGGATRRGTFSAHPDVLAEGAARAQGLIDAADSFAATVKEFAHKPSLGRLKTKAQADRAAAELSAQSGVNYRPVRVNPFLGRTEQLQKLLDTAGEGPEQPLGKAQPIREALEGAYRGEDGPGPWALIPDTAATEFEAHVARMGVGPVSKVGQQVGQAFRRAVLATSPSWFAGNLVEASMRTALAGAGPRSYRLGRDVLKRVDEISPKLGQEFRARAVGGGHFRSADTLHVRRGAEQFQGTQLEPIANALHKFWDTPGPRQTADVWKRWTDLVFRQVNGRIESHFQTAMLGRALRDSPLMPADLPRTSARAVDQAARGLTNTNEQAALARQVERMYGKYNGFTAGTRWAIAMYTPFVPWMLNAVKFVFDVLPRDHPTVTGLIAMTEQATDEWRKDRGLDLFIKEAVPGFLQGSIPLPEGRHQRAPNRYLPFGAFGDPLDTAAKAVLPQYSGVLAAFKGEDWKGAPLRNEDGTDMDTLGKAQAAAMSFVEATVPLLGIIKRVAEKGPSALNPFAPTAAPKVKVAAPRVTGNEVERALERAMGGGNAVEQALERAMGGVP
jgi:hypothetical protein